MNRKSLRKQKPHSVSVSQLQNELKQLTKKYTELQQNELRFKRYIENLKYDTFFYHHDNKGVFTYLSPSIQNVLGYTQKEFMQHYSRYLSKDKTNLKRVAHHTQQSLKGIQQPPYEVEIYNKKKSIRTLLVMESPIQDGATNKFEVIGIARDITKSKQAQRYLLESETFNLALLKAIPDMIFHIRKDGTFLNFRPALNQTLKPLVSPKEFLGKKVTEILPENVGIPLFKTTQEALKTSTIKIFECQLLKENKLIDHEIRIVPLNKNEVITIVRDITEIKNIEKQMHEICELSRRNIGQDLHDSLSQKLTGIAFMTRGLERKISATHPELTEEANKIIDIVNKSIAETRHLAHGLHPLELLTNGLNPAIKELALETEKIFGIKFHLISSHNIVLRDQSHTIHLYRIIQEAISNAVKHSKTNKVTVKLSQKGALVTATIRDYGIGFLENSSNHKGLGIKIMHHRAKMIGAILKIKSNKSYGTKVDCIYHL